MPLAGFSKNRVCRTRRMYSNSGVAIESRDDDDDCDCGELSVSLDIQR